MKFGIRNSRNEPSIEIGQQRRPSAFDLKRFNIKIDPSKDYRWADPKRVDEHKYLNGYEIHKAKDGEVHDESGHTRTKGNMVLMERNKDLARESTARKILRTEQQTRNVREMRREEIEKLSSKHGVDLHRHFMDKLEKIEDDNGG
jgi:hypothetical protein